MSPPALAPTPMPAWVPTERLWLSGLWGRLSAKTSLATTCTEYVDSGEVAVLARTEAMEERSAEMIGGTGRTVERIV